MSGSQQSLATYGVAGATIGGILLWLARSRNITLPEKTKDDIKNLDDKLRNNEFLIATLIKDLAKAGSRISLADLKVLVEFAHTAGSGKPFDDRALLTEKLMAIIAKLPETSRARKRLTDILVKGLWDSLDHPPLSFHGPKYQYRTADGSYNNVLIPTLGKAKMPYAKGIIPHRPQQTQRPDPEVLFDSLMARDPATYKENAGGLSTMLFHYATIIIHDIFRTNLYDPDISDTSSYVDLAPLYGSSEDDQATIRTFKNGMLKPDTYFEERLLSQAPAVNVMLVLYSRFHNYCADMLLKINEGGRFTLKPGDRDAAEKKQDEALFQTARLITGGLHAQIALHDYLRGLTNTHHSDSNWTLDPRGEIDKKSPIKPEVPRGIGNQVSSEFNLMYRFHSAVSKKDEKWIEDFYKDTLGLKDVYGASCRDVQIALGRYLKNIQPDPSKREFGGLKRGSDGKFRDEDLVRVLQDAIEDPAGAFGAHQVPRSLKAVEIMGIMRAREWNTATLNEFREFFGLKRHETFEDINPDPKVADILRTLYDSPDMVEAYPGMWIEDAKPAMTPGSGVCLPYTVGRAVFSDAITLVRSDRFYTIDFTPSTLTSWGLHEVAADYGTLGGSSLYKLIQRGLPGWFPFNSFHIMQPMYTPKMNKQIATKFGTNQDYTEAKPKAPPVPEFVLQYKPARQILLDINNFAVPGLPGFNDLSDGWDHSGFMLSGDEPRHVSQRRLMEKLIYCTPDFPRLVYDTAFQVADQLIRENMSYAGKIRGVERYQIDIIHTVAEPTLTHVLAGIFSLDLKTDENPEGFYDVAGLWSDLSTSWIWLFSNFDPARAWNRRRDAREAITRLRKTTKNYLLRSLPKLPAGAVKNTTLWQKISSLFSKQSGANISEGSIRWYGLQVAGRVVQALEDVEKAADVLSTCAIGGGGLPIGQFSDCYNHMLQPDEDTQQHFKAMTQLGLADTEDADKKLETYMWEAFRLSNSLRVLRIAKTNITVGNKTYKPYDAIVIPLGNEGIGKDPEVFPDPGAFKLNRPKELYSLYGMGQHRCLGAPISAQFVTAMLKAVSGLQSVQLNEGAFRRIRVGITDYYLTGDGSDLTRFPTTAKLTFTEYVRDVKKQKPPIYTILPSAKGEKTAGWGQKSGKNVIPMVLHNMLRPQDIGAEVEFLINHPQNSEGSEDSYDMATASSMSFYETEQDDDHHKNVYEEANDEGTATMGGEILAV